MAEFARVYIGTELGLRKKMYLIKEKTGSFPLYAAEEDLPGTTYELAYKKAIVIVPHTQLP